MFQGALRSSRESWEAQGNPKKLRASLGKPWDILEKLWGALGNPGRALGSPGEAWEALGSPGALKSPGALPRVPQ